MNSEVKFTGKIEIYDAMVMFNTLNAYFFCDIFFE